MCLQTEKMERGGGCMCGQSCFVDFTLEERGEREKEQDRWEEEQKTWADGSGGG